MDEIELFNKEKFVFTKCTQNQYKFHFNLENPNVYINKIIDFQFIKLIYDLNPDVYEKTNIEIINDNEANITVLIKHFFQDIGLPQRFSFVNITKTVDANKIIFVSKSITTHKPTEMPFDAELLPLQNMTCTIDITNPHNASVSLNVTFANIFKVPSFAEKILGLICFKVFKRVKQFIENISI